MLIRTDPFRELDRLAQQNIGTQARPAAMPLDAWREGDEFIVGFDLPGVEVDSIDLDIEQNVLTCGPKVSPAQPRTQKCLPLNGRGARSAGRCSWVIASTPKTSKPVTTAAC